MELRTIIPLVMTAFGLALMGGAFAIMHHKHLKYGPHDHGILPDCLMLGSTLFAAGTVSSA